MSCYEWEAGTIKLPSALAKPFRDASKRAVDAYKARLYAKAQEFWKALPPKAKRSHEHYEKHAQAYCWGNTDPRQYGYDASLPRYAGIADDRENGFGRDFEELLRKVLHHYEERPILAPNGAPRTLADGRPLIARDPVVNGPRRATQADVDALIGKATGTKFSIQCGESDYRIDGRVIHWNVPENNHACEHGRDHPLAQDLFTRLRKVQWTRGSGGEIVGNNEYAQEDRSAGGGGNYVVESFGPASASRRRTMVRR